MYEQAKDNTRTLKFTGYKDNKDNKDRIFHLILPILTILISCEFAHNLSDHTHSPSANTPTAIQQRNQTTQAKSSNQVNPGSEKNQTTHSPICPDTLIIGIILPERCNMTSYAKITKDVLVRYEGNPVLQASDFLPLRMRAVYNSCGVKMAEGKYVMLCRTNQLNHKTLLWGADSVDGLNWTLRPEPFALPTDDLWLAVTRSVFYDPRVTWIDGEYKVLIACEGDQNCRVALFTSSDLQTLKFVNYVNAPDNRNMVIFPEKSVDGRYMRLERPTIPSAGGKGNIWLSHSPDLIHWGDSYEMLKTTEVWNYAISGLGPSTVPVRTDEGWLILFHGIMNNCTTREYSVGAALLDLDQPWKVKHVTKHPILFPVAEYEMRGLVEHVCFPCSMIVEPDNSVKVYYGGADTYQCVALGQLEDIIYACKNW